MHSLEAQLKFFELFLVIAYIILFFLFFGAILVKRKIVKITYQKEKCLSIYKKFEESKVMKFSVYSLLVCIIFMAILFNFSHSEIKEVLLWGIFACLYGVLGYYLLKKIYKMLGEND